MDSNEDSCLELFSKPMEEEEKSLLFYLDNWQLENRYC